MYVIDHQTQKMIVGRATDGEVEEPELPLFSIDSLLAQGGKIQKLPVNNGGRGYRFEWPESLLYALDLELNKVGLIQKMVYHYQAIPTAQPAYERVEVRYQDFSFEPPAKSWFDEGKFFYQLADGEYQTAAAYPEYKISKVDYSSYLENY